MTRQKERDRIAGRPGELLAELLETHTVPRVLEALARACEYRAAALVPDHVALDEDATFAEHVASAIRRVARGIEAAERRRGFA